KLSEGRADRFGAAPSFGNRRTVPKARLLLQISTTSISRSSADRVEKMLELRGRELGKGN
ncbi:MAG: hypothetical protein WBF62_07410, partial [Bradyrhizobium sp.]